MFKSWFVARRKSCVYGMWFGSMADRMSGGDDDGDEHPTLSMDQELPVVEHVRERGGEMAQITGVCHFNKERFFALFTTNNGSRQWLVQVCSFLCS